MSDDLMGPSKLGSGLRHDDLLIGTVGDPDGDETIFQLGSGKNHDNAVFLSPTELRWLIVVAGPAMLAEYSPLKTPKEVADARAKPEASD